MKWIFRIYQKENRLDRLANRLIGFEKLAHGQYVREGDAHRAAQVDREKLRQDRDALQKKLDERDREFAALHADYVKIRRSWSWRLSNLVRNDAARIWGLIRPGRRPKARLPV